LEQAQRLDLLCRVPQPEVDALLHSTPDDEPSPSSPSLCTGA
jgi:hypothetical protein